MTLPFTHLILTRFNVASEFEGGKGLDADWLEHRMGLFERFCFPSLQAQTEQSFRWLLFCDPRTPDPARRRLQTYTAYRNVALEYVSHLTAERVRAVLRPYARAPVLITTRLDNDDVLARDFVERVHAEFMRQSPITSPTFINFPEGVVFWKGRLYRASRKSNSFITLLEPNETPLTVLAGTHTSSAERGRVLELDAPPMWMQVVHERNVYNQVRNCTRMRAREVSHRFETAHVFGDEHPLPVFLEQQQNRISNSLRQMARWMLGRRPS